MYIPIIERCDPRGEAPACLAEVAILTVGNLRFREGLPPQRRVGDRWVDLIPPPPPRP